jgi:hypothetical protein
MRYANETQPAQRFLSAATSRSISDVKEQSVRYRALARTLSAIRPPASKVGRERIVRKVIIPDT